MHDMLSKHKTLLSVPKLKVSSVFDSSHLTNEFPAAEQLVHSSIIGFPLGVFCFGVYIIYTLSIFVNTFLLVLL
jgi:hypothetical protein